MVLCAIIAGVALSVYDYATNNIAKRIAGADPAVCLSRFVGYPSGADKDTFVLNTNFWAKGIDFSCVSPWNGAHGRQRAGTLISKRHIIYANHFPLATGTRILFVGEEGGVCPCSLKAYLPVGTRDFMVGLLNAEVTPNIHPAKILPDDFPRQIGSGIGLPTASFNQNEELLLNEVYSLQTNGAPGYASTSIRPKSPLMSKFHKDLIGGDSGNPVFMLIGDQPILLYCLRSGGSGGGPDIRKHRREIQAVMDKLCPGYRLESFDFTSLRLSTYND